MSQVVQELVARLRVFWTEPDAVSPTEKRHLALAALLAEMMRADYRLEEVERQAAERLLRSHLGLDEAATDQLLRAGEASADEATSLFEHTRVLDQSLTEAQKFEVLDMLWQIAYADGRLEGHEDQLIHRIADLLHVRHNDLMRLKARVLDQRKKHSE